MENKADSADVGCHQLSGDSEVRLATVKFLPDAGFQAKTGG
jgi:hypothetical protein